MPLPQIIQQIILKMHSNWFIGILPILLFNCLSIIHFSTLKRQPITGISISDMIDKMKRSFFQTAVVSVLLYGCTTWTLIKRLEKKLDGNYTRMLRTILNKSWRQHPKKHQLYGHLPPITKTIEPGTQDTAGGAGTSS